MKLTSVHMLPGRNAERVSRDIVHGGLVVELLALAFARNAARSKCMPTAATHLASQSFEKCGDVHSDSVLVVLCMRCRFARNYNLDSAERALVYGVNAKAINSHRRVANPTIIVTKVFSANEPTLTAFE